MDIAECTLNGERYHAARFARLSPKRLAQLRQHLRCPNAECHAKAQFRKASSDGRAACFAARHVEGCTVEQEFPSLGRRKRPARPRDPADGASQDRTAARSSRKRQAAAQRSRAGGLGRAPLAAVAIPTPDDAADATSSGSTSTTVAEPTLNPTQLAVYVATPTAVARLARDEADDGFAPVPVAPAVIELDLSADAADAGGVDPMEYWQLPADARPAELPSFTLTSLTRRLAADPTVAALPSVIMANGFSGLELREFLVASTSLDSMRHRGRRRGLWGRIERATPAGAGLYLESGALGMLLSADAVSAIRSRDLGLTDQPESWRGATFIALGTPEPAPGGMRVDVNDPRTIVVLPAGETSAAGAAE